MFEPDSRAVPNIMECSKALMHLILGVAVQKEPNVVLFSKALLSGAGLTGTLMRHVHDDRGEKDPHHSMDFLSRAVAAKYGILEDHSKISPMQEFVQVAQTLFHTRSVNPFSCIDDAQTLSEDVGTLSRYGCLLEKHHNLTKGGLLYASGHALLALVHIGNATKASAPKTYNQVMEALAAGYVAPPVPSLDKEPKPVLHEDENAQRAGISLCELVKMNNIARTNGVSKKHPHAVLGTLGTLLGEETREATLTLRLKNAPDFFMYSQAIDFLGHAHRFFKPLFLNNGARPADISSIDDLVRDSVLRAQTGRHSFALLDPKNRPDLPPSVESALYRQETTKLLDDYKLTGWQRPSAYVYAVKKASGYFCSSDIDQGIGFQLVMDAACSEIHKSLKPVEASPETPKTSFWKPPPSSPRCH